MKKTAFILLLMFCASQFTPAQKIYLDYKLRTADNTYQLKANALSDEMIQKKSDTLFAIVKADKEVISIEDNTNRKFERIILRDTIYYPKVLNEGYFKLYELKLKDKPTYIVYSEKDTIVIEKKDSLVDNIIMKDRSYSNKLVYLSRDYPELWKDAGQVNFQKSDFQKFISVLNTKKGGSSTVCKEKNTVRFLTLTMNDAISFYGLNQITVGALMTKYNLALSSDLSFRYGARANFSNFFGTLETLEVPFQVNYEKTNNKITPLINLGVVPTVFINDPIPYWMVLIDATAGGKVKLTDNFNIWGGFNYSMYRSMLFGGGNSLTFNVGVEYSFKL